MDRETLGENYRKQLAALAQRLLLERAPHEAAFLTGHAVSLFPTDLPLRRAHVEALLEGERFDEAANSALALIFSEPRPSVHWQLFLRSVEEADNDATPLEPATFYPAIQRARTHISDRPALLARVELLAAKWSGDESLLPVAVARFLESGGSPLLALRILLRSYRGAELGLLLGRCIEQIPRVASSAQELGAALDTANDTRRTDVEIEIVKSVLSHLPSVTDKHFAYVLRSLNRLGRAPDTVALVQSVLTPETSNLVLAEFGRALRSSVPVPHRSGPLLSIVTNYVRVRHVQLAQMLRAAGWRIEVHRPPTANSDLDASFDEVMVFPTPLVAYLNCAARRPDCVLVASWMADDNLQSFLEAKFAPTVIEAYDCAEGFLSGDAFINSAELQRRFFTLADGVLWRDLRVWYLLKRLNYHRPRHICAFGDYLSEKPRIAPKRRDGVHVASVGFFSLGDQPFEGSWNYERTIQAFTAQGIHFHVYPHPSQDLETSAFRDFRARTAHDPYFHFHLPLPHNEMMEELRSYHFGATLVLPEAGDRSHYERSIGHFELHASRRIVDYLEAGLIPIVPRSFRYSLRYAPTRVVLEDLLQGDPRQLLKDALVRAEAHDFQPKPTAVAGYHASRIVRFFSRMRNVRVF